MKQSFYKPKNTMEFLLSHAQSIIILGGILTVLGGYLTYLKTTRDTDITNNKIAEGIGKTEEVKVLTEKAMKLY